MTLVMLTHLSTPCSPPEDKVSSLTCPRDPQRRCRPPRRRPCRAIGPTASSPGSCTPDPTAKGQGCGGGTGIGGTPPPPLCCPPRLASEAGRVNPTPWPTATAAGRVDPTQWPMERNAKKVPRDMATLPRIPIVGRHLYGFIQPFFYPPLRKPTPLSLPFLRQVSAARSASNEG